ncbi:hypothetical protein K3N28_10860 [Glycomyces sp. TRM65418]|uniref:hypothetical protein n=1 Tax=Glycomyces sp. TRM65418 TaxID=2867006 RepID=UPI001CE6280B|nr:hypothetical protein [Glycomyces sp. TRM65418]MCC3763572.1 hypothetical protein [Glycomyces sp. TRM65418]QZD57556.1 hypothetical protein K3N28_10800 [Glycomyces sp. TRM65418]
MNDQYRIAAPAPPRKDAPDHHKLTSAALWIGLAAGAVFNVGLQAAGLWILAVPFGLIAVGSAVALVVRAVAGGKRR